MQAARSGTPQVGGAAPAQLVQQQQQQQQLAKVLFVRGSPQAGLGRLSSLPHYLVAGGVDLLRLPFMPTAAAPSAEPWTVEGALDRLACTTTH